MYAGRQVGYLSFRGGCPLHLRFSLFWWHYAISLHGRHSSGDSQHHDNPNGDVTL